MATKPDTIMAWGVARVDSGDPGPLGVGWLEYRQWQAVLQAQPYAPTLPILFTSREHARAWCRERTAFYRDTYPEGHVCLTWRFRPVRVRVTVEAAR